LRKLISFSMILFAFVQGRQVRAQETEQVESGKLEVSGQSMPYRIRRLPLAAFPELPGAVRVVLEERHCTVPQTYEARRPENVIHGEFLEKGSRDWAVLCSHDGTSAILVFRSNALALPIELESNRDVDRLQARLNGTLGFAWGLDIAKAGIMQRIAGGKAGMFDHDGIQVSIVEKSSRIHYFHDGSWMEFDAVEY
jgi:hypothetical protein